LNVRIGVLEVIPDTFFGFITINLPARTGRILATEQSILPVAEFAEGHGVLVQLTADAPGEEPPEAGEGVGFDDEHGLVGAVGWVRH
jgi:hypothetical protein